MVYREHTAVCGGEARLLHQLDALGWVDVRAHFEKCREASGMRHGGEDEEECRERRAAELCAVPCRVGLRGKTVTTLTVSGHYNRGINGGREFANTNMELGLLGGCPQVLDYKVERLF